MQEPQDGLEGFPGEVPQKAKSSLIEAACLCLAKKLHGDYMDAYNKFRWPPEAESFAEDWMRKRVPGSSKTMTQAVWRNFLRLLVEHRGNE